jgi:iron complex transport system ATP-binding protein
MSAMSLQDARLVLGGRTVLDGVSLFVGPGELVALLGPNGAGKTSAVRALLGHVTLQSGHAGIDGKSLANLPARDRARSVAYLPQARPLAWPVAVREAVALGRFAHGGPMGRLTGADASAVDQAMEACAITALAERSVASLSGGELARVHVARALATGAPALVADEPTAALDPRHAFAVMDILKERSSGCGVATLVILHDLALAARFADRVVVLHEGRVAAEGPPVTALTPEVLAEVYGIAARWQGDSLSVTGLS